MKYTILLISILLIGCDKELFTVEESKPEIIERNITIEKEVIKEKIIYKNITIPCNLTCPNCTKYEYEGRTSREIELIRRIRFLESQTDKYINHSDCFDDLSNKTKRLKDCEEELCEEWNSSWC